MTEFDPPPADRDLEEQVAYYRAVAGEYETHSIPPAGSEELVAALDRFRPAGRVLELACGPGGWTERLLSHDTEVTAVDASPEMLARARARVGEHDRVRFLEADLFSFRPTERYDVVFHGFWISHVPPARFEAFWSMTAACLAPGGRVFFVDDAYRPPEELVEGESSPMVERRLRDGTAFRIVKVAYRPEDLEERLHALGWAITVTQTSGAFYWGEGSRSPCPG